MKIKELHIRNIASIEKADIDFEKNLCDTISGQPASLFLISGDTGAGKSVLLDGISMALYKSTPRVESVADQQNNAFKNSNGLNIKIKSLEQYTRLGISEKDECYSEVLFEGNNGLDYTARLSLGFSKTKVKKEDGTYELKYRSPAWLLRQGAQEWNKDADIREQLQMAIGLSFQQFNRMVMLAQGQFATFLCGKKEERTAILEQLTNTEQFSLYGKAIHRIFNRAKKAKEEAENSLKTANHLVGNIDEASLNQIITTSTDKKQKLTKQLTILEDKIGQLRQWQTAALERENAQQHHRQLIEQQSSEDFIRRQQRVTDWDSTDEVRRHRHQLLEQNQKQIIVNNRIEQAKNQYVALHYDQLWREQQLRQKSVQLQQLQAQLKPNEPHDNLFIHAQTVDEKLANYLDIGNKIVKYQQDIEKAKSAQPLINQRITEEETALKATEQLIAEKEEMIQQWQQRREALQPEQLHLELTKIWSNIQELHTLQNANSVFETTKTKQQLLLQQIAEESEQLNSLEKAYEIAAVDYAASQKRATEALSRYTIMSSSVEETLTELRKNLSHVSHCPLCGQTVENQHFDEINFEGMLSPLAQEKKETETARQLAETAYNDAVSKFNSQKTAISLLKKNAEEQQAEISLLANNLQKNAEKFALPFDGNLTEQLNTLLEITKKQELIGKEKLEEAEKIQKNINQGQQEKQPLMAEKDVKLRIINDLKNKSSQNAEAMRTLLAQQQEEETKHKAEQQKLDSLLRNWQAAWETDLAATRQQLCQQAQHYTHCKDQFITQQSTFDTESKLHKNLLTNDITITNQYPAWQNPAPTPSVAPCPYEQIVEQWNQLSITIGSIENEQNTIISTIKNCQNILEIYYQQSGHDSNYLDALISQAAEIEENRGYIATITNQIATQVQLMQQAERKIAEAQRYFQLSATDSAPVMEELLQQKMQLESERDTATKEIAEADTKLTAFKKQKSEIERLNQQLTTTTDRYQQWFLLDKYFGGSHFRTLVQSHILRPLLHNANLYLSQITDRYSLTCSEENEQLSIFVLDKYNKNEIRSTTVLSGGEKFMISLALSLALSSLNRPNLNVNILFIDEGFGTLDEKSLDCVMQTLESLPTLAGQQNRRVGIISHREELTERIPTQIQVLKRGEGRSQVVISSSAQ